MTLHTPPADDRRRKTLEILALGVDPFTAAAFRPAQSVGDIIAGQAAWLDSDIIVTVAGRIAAWRDMGRTIFGDLLDGTDRIQLMFVRATMTETLWSVLGLLDLGDFIGVRARVVRTRVGELTLSVVDLVVLGKAATSLPLGKTSDAGQHSAPSDVGLLSRQRHVALYADGELRGRIVKRARIIREVRRYFEDEDFIEVETPVLGAAYGGAAARPFTTRSNALGQDLYLRISPECALKRALCGGLNRVFEIGKNFRNEGIDASHNPEFTMIEWYEAWSDYFHQMSRFEELVPRIAEAVNGSTRIVYKGREINLDAPWQRLPVLDALREETGRDLREVEVGDFSKLFRTLHPGGSDAFKSEMTWGDAVMELFEARVEPRLWNPTFVMDHPLDVSPLTKRHRSDPRLVERFEPMVAGMEIGNSYSELNDPWEQYARLVEQQSDRENTYDIDEEFVSAMMHGMPQAGGSGLGIDRLVMLLTGATTIRQVVLFPMQGITKRSLEGHRNSSDNEKRQRSDECA